MNVRELKDALDNLPDDMIVVLAKDAEGNGFSPLWSASTDHTYWASSPYSGEAAPTKPDDVDEDDWDYYWEEGGVPCLLLDPIN